jgi:DNA-binding NtrC family response regulator
MTRAEVLLVDDEAALLRAASLTLTMGGLGPVLECSDPTKVMAMLASRPVAALLLDLAMPRLTGQELLALVRADYPDIPVIVMTGASDLQVAVSCMQQGAVDYLVKPVEPARLCSAVRRALEQRQLRADHLAISDTLLGGKPASRRSFAGMVAQSRVMQDILRGVEAIAPSAAPVLITGETGTGKRLVAESLHRLSRRPGALVTVPVGALDDTSFAAALFGHARTADAPPRAGHVQAAGEGTLFLDEVAGLGPQSQAWLLRLLEDGAYEPVGSAHARHNRARVLTATSSDLQAKVEAGQFRADLYYRLRTHTLRLPPLRERFEELPLLVEHFLEHAATSLGKPVPTVPMELYQLLRTHSFPGNLSELRDLCLDAVAHHAGRVMSMRRFRDGIAAAQKVHPASPPAATIDAGEAGEAWWLPHPLPSLKNMKRMLILEALHRAEGNQSVAAPLIGMSRSTYNTQLGKLRRNADDDAEDDDDPGEAPPS